MNNKSLPILIIVALVIAGGAYWFFMRADTAEEDLADDQAQEMEVDIEQSMNIVETAIATESLSTLVAAIQAADLVEALSDESVEFTVFAPTNDAFADIQETVDTLLLPENQADLQNVLQYHVVVGRVMSTDLSDGMEVTALNGDTLVITIEEGRVFVNGAEVVIADVQASNGVVHVIDTVLVP